MDFPVVYQLGHEIGKIVAAVRRRVRERRRRGTDTGTHKTQITSDDLKGSPVGYRLFLNLRQSGNRLFLNLRQSLFYLTKAAREDETLVEVRLSRSLGLC